MMRDPMGWALTVFRVFGIPVRVHLFFFIVTLGLFLRQTVFDLKSDIAWLDVFLVTVVMLFGVVLLHEFGHCFAARALGGEANEIVIWPLGGLAMLELPPFPKAHFWAAAAGPITNALLASFCAFALLLGGFWPNLNPLANPYTAAIQKQQDGRIYTSEYDIRLYPVSGGTEPAARPSDIGVPQGRVMAFREEAARRGLEWAVAPTWAVWLQRFFWINWLFLLVNLLPAYPLDGGQMLYAVIWHRSGQRQAARIAGYSGFFVATILLILSIGFNEALLLGLGLFMIYSAYLRLVPQDTEDGPFGYDFSAGYTSLEKDDTEISSRPRRRGSLFKRWLQSRAAKKIHREEVQRSRDDERMDLLLSKIAQLGQDSLSEEERRFMQRVSARYRNRS